MSNLFTESVMTSLLRYPETLKDELLEPAWPYDMDDSYMQLDLGPQEESLIQESVVFVLKRPWFKQNYRHLPKKNLRLYRRPYFHVAEE